MYLTMQSYIEVMTDKLGIDVTKGKSCKLPMSDDVTDMDAVHEGRGQAVHVRHRHGGLADGHRPSRRAGVSLALQSIHGCARQGGTQGHHAHSSLLCGQQGAVPIPAVGHGRCLVAHVFRFRSKLMHGSGKQAAKPTQLHGNQAVDSDHVGV